MGSWLSSASTPIQLHLLQNFETKMANEQFCLKWNDFETNVSTAFRELREDKDFFDVTLACDDEQIQAHKVILAACSTFFRTVLRRNRHEHPLLYLKGVKYIDLVAVLNFMYHGEVNVAQEQLNDFLSIAEDLKVKGLTQNQSHTAVKDLPARTPDIQNVAKKEPPDRKDPEQRQNKRPRQDGVFQQQKQFTPQSTEDDDDIQEVVAVKAEPIASNIHENIQESSSSNYGINNTNTVAVDQPLEQMYEEVYEPYESYEEGYEDPNAILAQANAENKGLGDVKELLVCFADKIGCEGGGFYWQCKCCHKNNKRKSHLLEHVESTHIPGLQFQCPYCDGVRRTRSSVRSHVNEKHKEEHLMYKRDTVNLDWTMGSENII